MMRKLALPTRAANSADSANPTNSAAFSISGVNKSVSKLEIFPCSTAATRSNPIPVSIEGFGSGVSV